MSLYCCFCFDTLFRSRISIVFCLCRIVEGFTGVDDRVLEAVVVALIYMVLLPLINKYYVYRALVCSHCIDGRGTATSAMFAMCRLSLSFLVYSPSHTLVTMPELLSAGQPSFWRGPTSVLQGARP